MKSALFASLALLLTACSSSLSTEGEVRSTNINFAIEHDSHVLLWVENSYQTKVKTLVDENLSAGSHTVELEMIDEKGNSLPSGLYFYHLETAFFSISRTLTYDRNYGR